MDYDSPLSQSLPTTDCDSPDNHHRPLRRVVSFPPPSLLSIQNTMNTDQMDVTENISIESVDKGDKNSTDMESKNTVSNLSSTLCPVTPYSNKESVIILSPLTTKKDNNSQSTPVEDVFDVLDSQPDKPTLGLNPNLQSSGSGVARKLDFSSKEGSHENGAVTETVYESILDAIISKQAEDILAEVLHHDVLMTPPSVARLDSVAETCPGAPLKPKPVRKLTNANTGLCRKLEF